MSSLAAAGQGDSATASSLNKDKDVTTTKETTARHKRRIELRELNLAALDPAASPSLGKLDSSLKRHQTLLTRLRSSLHTPANIPGILSDIKTLALEKYIEEAVGATLEGLGRCKTGAEVQGAVEIVSALHQRFPALFTPPFVASLLAALKPTISTAHSAAPADREIKEKEDSARVIKQRGLLRILGELEVVGIVSAAPKKGSEGGQTGEVCWGVLKELLTADKESLALAAPLGIAFAKHLGHLFLPPVAPSTDSSPAEPSAHDFPSLASTLTEPTTDDELIPREVKDKFRKLLVAYLEALGRRETKRHLELQKADKRNHEAYIRSGEVFEDREKMYEKSVKAWERGWSSVTQLSELLSLPVPALPSLSSSTLTGSLITSGTSAFAASNEEIGGPGSLWIDEEDKRFYEDLKELRGEVPAGFLGVAVPKEGEATEEAEKKTEEDVEMTDTPVEGEAGPTEESADAAEENPTTTASTELASAEPDPSLPAGPAAQLTALFARLSEASSRATIDAVAVDFAFLNSKAARKRLVKFLGSVNRNRQDILPYYARLVGTLDPFMPDIGRELIALLEDEFRYLQRKKNTDMAETRSKNLRFLSELTKFRVTPIHSILHVFKILLDDFTGPNVDNLCTVLEGCGRFLLRSEATSEKMRIVLETMKRKKAAMHLDQRQITMLENAYYQCDPPDRPAIAPKERTPMQLYIRHLFYNALTRNSSDRVLKLVRKLHWEDPAIVRKLHSAFTKVWKIKYSNVHLFAVLLYDLGRYHPEFSVAVIDEVLENIRVGMEVGSFKYNQQRVATIKYLGELYNYRVIDSRVVFDTLWSLVTFGHPEGRPYPDVPSPIDPVDDCFRVRLVCTLLDTCGSCFERGALKKKLDSFLTFFQMYTLSKGTLPMDVEFMLSDTFESLRPKLVLFKTFGEAAVAVEDMMAAVAKAGPVEDEPEEIEAETGAEGRRAGAGDERDEAEDGNESDGTISDDEDGVDVTDSESESEDETLSRPKDPNAITQEEEDEFNRELAKMMAGAGEVRKTSERKPALMDVGVPFVKKARGGTGRLQHDEEDELVEGEEQAQKGMKFTLLTKKGSKQQTLSMEIPLESSIAVHTLEKRAQDKAEKQELKRFVMEYESREEASEKQALKDTLARRGINLKYQPPPSSHSSLPTPGPLRNAP